MTRIGYTYTCIYFLLRRIHIADSSRVAFVDLPYEKCSSIVKQSRYCMLRFCKPLIKKFFLVFSIYHFFYCKLASWIKSVFVRQYFPFVNNVLTIYDAVYRERFLEVNFLNLYICSHCCRYINSLFSICFTSSLLLSGAWFLSLKAPLTIWQSTRTHAISNCY